MAKDQGGEFADPNIPDNFPGRGDSPTTAPAAPAGASDFFGEPRGLSTLFFTELWERFSYYGMRALLVLFMTAAATGIANPGLGFGVAQAGAVYGLYTFFVYVLALPGGWLADNLWGQRRSVFVGGCIIALGHFTMAGPLIGLPEISTFYLGLAFITVGTGLLKPNVSVMVGGLYPEGGARRDAGFSIFYMGINLGAILGPTLCGILGEGYNWHLGFSLAGFGMLLGLVSYKLGEHNLGEVGLFRSDEDASVLARRSRNFYLITAGAIGAVILLGVLMSTEVIPLSLIELARILGVTVALIAVVYFAYLILGAGWILPVLVFAGVVYALYGLFFEVESSIFAYQVSIGITIVAFIVLNLVRMGTTEVSLEKKRFFVIFWLFLLAALFWSGFEQAGSTLNIFANEQTDLLFGPYTWLEGFGTIIPPLIIALPLAYITFRIFRRENLWWVGKAGVAVLSVLIVGFTWYVSAQVGDLWEMPASMLQNVNPLFIVLLAPVFGYLWVWLAQRNANPSIPVKFALGLLGLAAGFFVISWGAAQAAGAPGGASPAWLIVMYFLFTCGELCLSPVGLSSMTKLAPENRVSQMMGIWFVASALGTLFAGLVAGRLETLSTVALFQTVAFIVGITGLIALFMAPPIKKLMGDIK